MTFIFFVVFLAAGSVVPWDSCTWPTPKLNFDTEAQVNELVNIAKIDRRETLRSESKQFSQNDIYYFSSSTDGIDVCADSKSCFRITVPEFSYRPISVKWINEKLLYVDMSFNPHAGAYWIIDTETQTIVYSEHWLDDLTHWLQCHKENK